MHRWSSGFLGIVGLCLAAACSPGASNTAASNAAPVDTVITPAQFPIVKVGYWEHTELDNGGAPQTTYACENGNPLDPNSFASGCTSLVIKHTAKGDYTIDMVCPDGDTIKTTHVVMRGDPNLSYTLDATATAATPGQPTVTEVRHQELHFAGPCPTS